MKNIFNRPLWKYLWIEWIKPILIAAALAMLIRTFIAQPFKIPTNSMYPTLRPGDRIFVSKFIYGARVPFTDLVLPKVRDPKTGDIVVFKSPTEKKKYLVKRFIAGGGAHVEIRGGKIMIDGKIVEEKPLRDLFYYNRGEYGAENKVMDVPAGHFYVLGDNSANSMDSRYWGFVPCKNLVGRAFVIHWPLKRIQLLREGD
ncbi:MAG: signal peptidase I [Candidatus Omnitrophica bacterium]|nr:signal peptidase I [Candidatus Omnitrophota bacterium]